MADENLVLRYLTDLTPATAVSNADLLHINQGGSDRSITIEAIVRSIIAQAYPVGKVALFSNTANPNLLFPGTRWARVPGGGSTIRIAATDAEVLTTGGADSITIGANNLPSHNHYINLNTQAHNFGTITSASAGNHNHTGSTGAAGNHQHQAGLGAPGASWSNFGTGTDNTGYYSRNWTGVAGNHTHTVTILAAGAHTHTVTLPLHTHSVTGNTQNTGNGQAFSIVNKFIKLAAWHRTG